MSRPNEDRLSGRTVLITGASSGIGVRFAQLCANAGASVVIGARRIDRLQKLQDDLRAQGSSVLAVPLNVADEGSMARAYDAAEAAFGTVDCVVANAGINVEGRAMDISMEDWDRLFATNVRGAFLTAREGAKRMRSAGIAERGRIVLISSITAQVRTTGTVAYSTSKAAVTHMGRLLAREWARSGPNVNILSPGYISSELAGDWFETDGGKRHISTWPRKRLLDEDALDNSLLFLLSDASRNVTGSDIVIDDGQSL